MDFALNIYTASLLIVVLAIIVSTITVVSRRRHEKGSDAEKFNLDRHEQNPVISPRPHNEWEAQGTFNPAAVTDSQGNIHLLYRSVGADGLSNIGHSKSKDGFNFNERSSFPIYQPESGTPKANPASEPVVFDPNYYTSGGGWGGFEDPRAVVIENKVYMTYINFAGWNSVRIGLTSIAMKDLEAGKWNWKKPKLISPANAVSKNWLLFPEKINGKFVLVHGISPKVLIEYLDNIDDYLQIKEIKSVPQHHGYGYEDKAREEFWDNRMKGAGPPPLKTDKGWLLLYHALDKRDPGKYKLGAMILDLKDPSKVLFRSPSPILEPNVSYENDGKPGVVYATGAIIKDGDLVVYYGGGDKHVCVAKTPLVQLLDWLVAYGKV
ncbi:MAG: hypothetical protein V4481_01670 [Patescibacteria group bacterium]